MSRYTAPLADLRFALHDVLAVEAAYRRLPGCEAATRDVIDAVLEEAAKFAEQVLAPLNRSGDAEGCSYDKATQTVSDVRTLSLADGRDLTPDPHKTPTRGRQLTALEQVLGTVGHQQLTNDQDSNPGNNNHRRD